MIRNADTDPPEASGAPGSSGAVGPSGAAGSSGATGAAGVLRADVCICGGGPAGITLALSLARRGVEVLLIEGGDEYFTDESQMLYRGTGTGIPYYELDETRLRFLGGSSNHWTGHCGVLDDQDFRVWDFAPKSGWPIEKADLDPYLDPVLDIMELPHGDARFADLQPLPVPSDRFRAWQIEESPPVLFAQKFYDEIAGTRNLTCILNLNLIDIVLNDAHSAVDHVVCASNADPDRRIEVRAKDYALSLGGIENARALLNATGQEPAGVGNRHDQVGRYFSEHPHAIVGEARLRRDTGTHFVSPTAALQAEKQCLNFGLRVYTRDARQVHNPLGERIYPTSKRVICKIPYADRMAAALRDELTYCDAMLWAMTEQSINPENRITLIDARDRYGLRRANLNWTFSELDWHTLESSVVSYGEYMIDNGLGRARVHPWILDRDPSRVPKGGNHHMSTTRMSADPRAGVVDAECRVHGVANLYVGGCSVFATGGHINPTFTIVQLALRLGDTLSRQHGALR